MRIIISIVVLSWLSTLGFAQPINSIVNDLDIPTPQAASFGKFGEIPVNHLTGVPDISVPIHTISEGKLTMPLSLRYHASGVKLSEIPGWVGAGWNLNTGGIISRVVQGRPDDGPSGFYSSGSTFDPSNNTHRGQVVKGERDGEPDIFSYSIPGYSGKFYIEKDKKIQQMPRTDVKIEMTKLSGLAFHQFTVTAPNGTRYIFGYYNDNGAQRHAREVVEIDVEGSSSNISSWLLVRVETYDRLFHIDYYYVDDEYSYTYPHTCQQIIHIGPGGCSSNQQCLVDDYTIDNQGKSLSQITTSTETIDFTGDHSGLDSIEVTSGSFCKRWVLGYDNSIFGSRLTLNSLQQKSCDASAVIPPYQFTYNASPTVSRFSNMIDHWGYYNGATGNDAISQFDINIPSTTIASISKGQSNRDTDSTAILSGSLASITYPTGGSTSFEFQCNRLKSTLLDPSTLVVNLKTTNYTLQDCFNELDTIGYHTFTSQVEIDNADISFTLIPEPCTSNQEEFYLDIDTYKKNTMGNWVQVGNVNIQQMHTTESPMSGDFTDLIFGGIATPGEYRFDLRTTAGDGRFKLFASTSAPGNMPVGGLRIKKITTHDGMTSNRDIVKDYIYRDPNDSTFSSGKLLRMPMYGALVSGLSVNAINTLGPHQFVIFREDNIVPLSTLEGYHMHYTDVEERIDTGGYGSTKYAFFSETAALSGFFPIEPGRLAASRGQLAKSEILWNTGYVTQAIDVISSQTKYDSSSNYLKPFVANVCTDENGTLHFGALNQYNLRHGQFQVTEKETTLDRVTSNESFEYDALNRFVAPIRSTMINSDLQKHHSLYTYPHDLSGTQYKAMADTLNMIQPVVTIEKVGPDPLTAIVVDSQAVEYKKFTTNEGSFPYPHKYWRDEVTWEDGSPTTSRLSQVLQATINAYDGSTGLPSSITIDGWDPTSYSWNTNGTKDSETFNSFTKSYQYHPNTKLISSVTGVDNTTTSFQYDQLCRLQTRTEECKNVSTLYNYNYGNPLSGGNFIRTRTKYPLITNSDLDSLVNREFYDGLGRSIQLIRENQGPTPNDDIVTAVRFNQVGRVMVEYEPKIITNDFFQPYSNLTSQETTINTHEQNPLLRPTFKVHSAFNYHTRFDYFNNITAINGHLPDELYERSTVDFTGDKRETITYIDRRGRTIATLQAGTEGSSPLTTNYKYDNKDRQIEIIPPNSSSGNTNLNFTYEYYGNDLLKFKKLPDHDSIEYRYNNRDLLMHYQDGFLRGQGALGWMAYNYDEYGRQTMSGFSDTPLNNNISTNPSISAAYKLSETVFFTTGNHIDKTENYFWRALLPDGALGQLRQSQFNYDDCGRMTLNRSSTILSPDNGVASLNHNRHDYTYDGADNIVLDDHQQTAFVGNTFVDLIQTIDFAGRQDTSNHRFENGTNLGFKSIAKNSYNQWNLLDKLDLGFNINGGYLETCNYSYLGNQWIQSMNGSLFDFNIYYDSAPQSLGNPQNNGNIAEIHWQVMGGDSYAFGYEYDLYNRLTQSKSKNITANKNDEYNTTHVYDDRGNLTSMTRSGLFPIGNALISGPIDDLIFTPKSNSNKIEKVTETSLQSYGAKGSVDSFEYDSNGNLTRDPTKEATIDYNHLNLPRKVTFDHGGTIEWTYDADETILRKQVKQGSHSFEDRYYIGSGEYKDGELVQFMHPYGRVARANPCNQNQFIGGLLSTNDTYQGDNIISNASVVPIGTTIFEADESIVLNEEFAVTNNKVFEAYIEPCIPGDWEYEYQLNDHLGNTRLIFSDRDDDGDIEEDEIVQQMHYYSFGMELNGDWKGGLKNDFNYKYNGKEAHADFDLGWLSYGARFYDPSIGRFTSVDPLADDPFNTAWSPFAYTWNNPLNSIDPDGRFTVFVNSETEETVEVNDGIDKTINVGEADFEKAKEFAEKNDSGNKHGVTLDGEWTNEDQKEYSEFYASVNNYNEFSVGNVMDYLLGGPVGGMDMSPIMPGGKSTKTGITTATNNIPKPTISQIKKALKKVYEKLGIDGPLPKAAPNKWGSPQRKGNGKGYRLDPPHDNHKKFWHIDYWFGGKRKAGGTKEHIPID